MAAFPPGQPGEIRSRAADFARQSQQLAQLRSEQQHAVHSLVAGQGGWSGAAAQAFEEHAHRPASALSLLEDSLAGAARAADTYADRLDHAQRTYREAESLAAASGLRLVNMVQVDPSSLLPPNPAKAAAAAGVEWLIAQATLEATEASAGLVKDLALPLARVEQAKLDIPTITEVAKVGADVLTAGGLAAERMAKTAEARAHQVEEKLAQAGDVERRARAALARIQQEGEQAAARLKAGRNELEDAAPRIEKLLQQLQQSAPGLARRLGLDPGALGRRLGDAVEWARNLASHLPAEAAYLARVSGLEKWYVEKIGYLNQLEAAARQELKAATEEISNLRPVLRAAEESAHDWKAVSVAGKAAGRLLIVPAMAGDYSEFYGHSHDPAWSSLYASENVVALVPDIVADVLIAGSVLVGPEAAVIGVVVAAVGTGAVIGVQAVTRYVYDHREGWNQNKVGFAAQAGRDFAQDAKESWDLLPLPTPVKIVALSNPVTQTMAAEVFMATLLLHSKGWI